MIKALGTSLLLLLLLTLGGQALASCHSAQPEASKQTGSEHLTPVEQPVIHPHQQAADGPECELSCCPGHCTNGLPASLFRILSVSSAAAADTYSASNADPIPESVIRPPISA